MSEQRKFRVAAINFDHMHIGDLLRMARNNPRVEIVGVSDDDPNRARPVLQRLELPGELIDPDFKSMLARTQPDLVILCPATSRHLQWLEMVAPFKTHILIEKPFASSLAEADRMIEIMSKTGRQLVINWPLRWYPAHVTAKRLIDEGAIGEVIQVHYCDGNRGPLRHMADKVVVPEEIANSQKATSWWYKQKFGGGSMLDYLGYGATLGTWFMNGRAPVEVSAMVDWPEGLEVDEHSIAVLRYDIPNSGLSKFETRWGTFTDPWTLQPQPKCGFVLVGREGTLSSYDFEKTVRLQTRKHEAGIEIPVDCLEPPFDNPINYVLHCIETGQKVDGPLSPAIARIGQQIVDTAYRSAMEKRTLPLIDTVEELAHYEH